MSHKPETFAFASFGLAGVAMILFAVTSMVHFVDGAPQVVARLEHPRAVSPPAHATTAGQATNLVVGVKP